MNKKQPGTLFLAADLETICEEIAVYFYFLVGLVCQSFRGSSYQVCLGS